jgi:hypothetical protein
MTLISHGRLNGRRFHQVMDPDTGRAALWICLRCRGELPADAGAFEKHDCWNYQKAPRPRVKRDPAALKQDVTAPETARDLANTYVKHLEGRLELTSDVDLIRDARDMDSRATAAPLYRTRLDELEAEEAIPTNDEEN